MNIEKVECWKHVGYAEESLDVPKYPLNTPPDLTFNEAFPSPTRLFSEFHLPIEYDECRDIKYIRLKYKGLETIYYGWIDNITIATTKLTVISWHVDFWRTYYQKAKFSKVWIKRRPYHYGDEIPYPKVPIRYQMSGLEDISICGQRDGIYWVILLYLANETTIWDCLKSIFPSVIVSNTQQILEQWGEQYGSIESRYHFEQWSNYLWGIGNKKLRELQRDVTQFGNKLPMLCNLEAHLRCCAFPIIADSIHGAFFRDSVYNYVQKGQAPALEQILNGTITNGLGLTSDHFIGAFISPVCPIRHVSGDGRWSLDPIVVEQDSGSLYNFKSSLEVFPKFKIGYIGLVPAIDVSPSGTLAIGDVSDGCPALRGILDTYYTYYREMATVDGTGLLLRPWELEDISSNAVLEIDDSQYPQFVSVDPDMSRKCKYVRLSDLIKTMPNGKMITRLNFTTSIRADNVYYSDTPGKWEMTTVDNRTRWTFVPPSNFQTLAQRFYDIPLMRGICRYQGVEWVADFYAIRVPALAMHPRQIWVPIGSDDFERNFIAQYDDRTSFCYMFGFQLDKKQVDQTVYLGIENYTMVWPVIYKALPYEVWGDESRDLVLIGPDSQIIHTFRKHIKYKSYCYEITMGTGSAYLRITFFAENHANLHPAINEEVAVYPLPPFPIFTSKVNEYELTGQKAADLATMAVQDSDRKENVKQKEQSGLVGALLGAAGAGLVGAGLPGLLTGHFNMGAAMMAMGGGAAKVATDKWFGNKSTLNAAQTAEKMQKIKEDQLTAAGMQMMGNGTIACLHTFRGVSLGYLHKDRYSMEMFYKAISKTGVDVSEYYEEVTDLGMGPYQFDEAAVEGDIPREAAVYIHNRLRHGVYINPDL